MDFTFIYGVLSFHPLPGRRIVASGPIRILRKWGAISICQRRPKPRRMAKDATPTVGPDGTCFKIPEQVPEKVHDLEFDGWEIIILKLYEIVILRDTTYFQTLHIQKKWQCGNAAVPKSHGFSHDFWPSCAPYSARQGRAYVTRTVTRMSGNFGRYQPTNIWVTYISLVNGL